MICSAEFDHYFAPAERSIVSLPGYDAFGCTGRSCGACLPSRAAARSPRDSLLTSGLAPDQALSSQLEELKMLTNAYLFRPPLPGRIRARRRLR